MEPRAEVLESEALLQGSIEIVERKAPSERRLRGTTVKRYLAPHLHALLLRAPAWLLSAYLRYLAVWVDVLAGLPGNRLLESCRYVATLAARRGLHHAPHGIYRRFVAGAVTVVELGFVLFRHGADELVEHLDIAPADLERLRTLVECHGGTDKTD